MADKTLIKKTNIFRTRCLLCNSRNLVRIIDLGIHPYADTFISKARLAEREPRYPLLCDLCKDCGQIQAACITDPGQRYSLYDYSYTSSNSAFARNHWEEYAKDVSRKLKLKPHSFIIEAGSNDGFLAEQFQKQGHKVLGVDPSAYMAKLAKKRGVKTLVDLFNIKSAEKILKKFGKAQLIVANNVFNHSDLPLDFAKGAAALLEKGGTFVFESPYWFCGFKTKKFDQIYHEHISYFTVRSAAKVFEKAGLKISDVQLVDYHGGSIRVFGRKKEEVKKESAAAKRMIEEEFSCGIFDPKSYKKFMREILAQRDAFLKKVRDIKRRKKSIVAVGAAAKGNTLLNFYRLDKKSIDFVTDASPHKCGKYTPLTRIPICGDDIFAKYKEVYALILSWNISDALKNNLYKINPKIKFLSL